MCPEAKVNILLVDEQLKNLLAWEAILEKLGQNLVKAHSGEEALRYLRQEEFAVILLDMQMPESDGLETVRLIRERRKSRHTPIIFMTNRDNGLRGYSLGTVDYLLKPIVPEFLLSKVSVFISLFQKTQEIKQQAAQLKACQQELKRERAKHQQSEAAWQRVKEALEIKLAERTGGLRRAKDDRVLVGLMDVSVDMSECKPAELTLEDLNQQLEWRIQQRTAELQQTNERLQAEARERRQVEKALRQRTQRERLLTESVQRIRETLDLNVILNTTVEEVRQLFEVDRVLVYRLWSDGTGSTIAEAVVSGCRRILGQTFPAEVFPQQFHQLYCQGRVRAVVNPETDQVTPCLIDFLKHWGVKSKLVVPIVYQGELWGLLIAHHCCQPRQWQKLEMDLLQQLAIQLAIAIYQADLYQQLQLKLVERQLAEEALCQARDQLEIRIAERTAELTQINRSLQAEICCREAAARHRIAAEEALRTSEERFRVALKNSHITVFNQDTDLRYTWVYNSIPGLSIEQVVGKLDCEIFGTEDAQRLTAIKSRVLTTGVGTRAEASITISGEVRYYELTVEPLLGSMGEITGITCATMDITEIRAREQQLRAIFESSLDAIAIVDDEGTCVEANPAACQLFGLPLSELIGQSITHLMAPDFDFESMWRTVVDLGQGTGELRLLRPDGTVRDVEYAAKASFLPGRHLAVLRDITERKQTEEIRRALEAEKELRRLQLRFFSMVSHEFRTPLSTILGSAQLLKLCSQAWTEEKKLRNLGRIETAAKNMTQLLDDLLTINRAESGKLECHPQPLDLGTFCRGIVEDVELQTNPKPQIKLTIHGQCPRATLDEKLMRSILNNLLSNAIKYSPEGGQINLTLNCTQEEATFQIQDRGLGIPLEDQTHLFELFHRGKNIANIPGTGLGLSVVKKCLELQGGEIFIQSEVGVGTTVTVKIPLIPTNHPLTQ